MASLDRQFPIICGLLLVGVSLSSATNVCTGHPCIHGYCTITPNGMYSCICVPGYTDNHCFTDIDDCQSSPCVHGQCLDGVNTYTCVCTPGYTGTQCNTGINECVPNPCDHGHCIAQPNGFTCDCDYGYTGMSCDTIVTGVRFGPTCYHCRYYVDDPAHCRETIRCNPDESCSVVESSPGAGIVRYDLGCTRNLRCSVILPFLGVACARCCSGSLCNGNCTTTTPTVSPASDMAEADVVKLKERLLVDPCTMQPCGHGICTSTAGGTFRCSCFSGYTGTLCDKVSAVSHGPICYHCHYAVDDPTDCGEITICGRDQMCSVNERPAVAGVRKYNVRCLETAPCQTIMQLGICATCCTTTLCNRHCTVGTPMVSAGSTTAAPPSQCEDDASCQQLVSALKAAHHNVCTMPSLKYMCNQTCGVCHSTGNTGSTGSTTHHWSTVTTPASTPLVTSPAGPCTLGLCLHGNCSSLSGGGFVCSCYPGYSGMLCDAANGACATGQCLHGVCTNTAGGYHCNCHAGYLGTNCTTRDPCTMRPCRHGQCISTTTGGFRCLCDPGYTGVLCDAATSACARNPCIHGSCVDSGNGQYHCNCDPGYTDSNCFTDINDCQSSPCVHGQCLDGVNTYTCVCNPGYTGAQCNTVINECMPNPCHHGKCVDWTNGFICQCDMTYTGMTCDTKIHTRDCKDIQDLGMTNKDNVFTVKYATNSDLDIKCDLTTDGGGWTVLMYRDSNRVNFDHRDFTHYAVGFGNINDDYWIGLEKMHSLTSDGRRYQLRIELYDAGGHMYYEIYDDFRVDGRLEFRLHVGAGRGTAGDSLSNHTGYGFTTLDEDRDSDSGVNCAAYLHAGWWFHQCYDSCLTCPYLQPGTYNCASMSWNSLGYCVALSKAVMMVRPM